MPMDAEIKNDWTSCTHKFKNSEPAAREKEREEKGRERKRTGEKREHSKQ